MKKRTAKPRDWSEAEKQHLVMLVRGGMSTRAISNALPREFEQSAEAVAAEVALQGTKRWPPECSAGIGIGRNEDSRGGTPHPEAGIFGVKPAAAGSI